MDVDVAGTHTPPPPRHCRRADRRVGIDTLVRGVATDLLKATNRRNLAMLLTERLATLTRVRSVPQRD
jgi:hypothetical protein